MDLRVSIASLSAQYILRKLKVSIASLSALHMLTMSTVGIMLSS
jgi:hypothetical protein